MAFVSFCMLPAYTDIQILKEIPQNEMDYDNLQAKDKPKQG